MKTVSVVIPNYNNEGYVARAIESVLSQTFTDYEIIVVDDGSTDNSKRVINTFGNKVQYIFQENRGLGGARNTGILASNSEFIGLLDADDEWQPTFLEKMISLARRQPNSVVYYSAAQAMDSAGNDLPQIFGRMVSSDTLYGSLLRANFIIPSTVVFRRSVILETGLFEEKNRELHGCEDWDLWLRLAPSFQFSSTDEVLVRYRLHTNTFSANPAHMQDAVKSVIEKNFGVNDGKVADWSAEKRRAFGGVYRYRVLTSVQKQGNWDAATESLGMALEIDPTLAKDIDFFYELAYGSQVPGFRETIRSLNLQQNSKLITEMLIGVFDKYPNLSSLRRKTFGIAYYAIGLVAYNTKNSKLSKQFILKAFAFSPDFLLNRKAVSTMIRALMNPLLGNRFRRIVKGNYAG